MTTSLGPFSAVVLAGGRSTRMGTDKASLRLPDGRSLLRRQLDLLASIGPDRLLVSARQGQVLPDLPDGVERVDDAGDAGPLGGIVAALRRIAAPRLLVVAVDLPQLDAAALRPLLQVESAGAVPQVADHLEPLAAVYPRAWLPHAEAALRRGDLSLQRLLRAPETAGWFSILNTQRPASFLNWNSLQDFPRANTPMP